MTPTQYTRRELARMLVTVPALRVVSTQVHARQIGYCTSLKNVPAARASGFDYAELSTTEVAGLSDADFVAAEKMLGTVGLPTPVSNLFLPAALKVTGPQIDRDAQSAYVRKAFERVARLGVRIVVFGSGGARRVPEGVAREDAFGQLVDFGRRIGQLARTRDITVAIEPLRSEESNIINSAAEGLRLVEAIGDPSFQLMVDFFHLSSERENPEIILGARGHLRHVHMANPKGRVFPLAWDEFDYQAFFANLGRIGYDGRISIEASTQNLSADAPRAIALLRQHASGN